MRDTKLLEKFLKDNYKKIVEMSLFRNLKKEVNAGANGTLGYKIKKGINKSNNDSIAIIDLDRTYKIEDLNYIANQFINDYKLEYDLISGERKIDTTNTSKLKIIGNVQNTLLLYIDN